MWWASLEILLNFEYKVISRLPVRCETSSPTALHSQFLLIRSTPTNLPQLLQFLNRKLLTGRHYRTHLSGWCEPHRLQKLRTVRRQSSRISSLSFWSWSDATYESPQGQGYRCVWGRYLQVWFPLHFKTDHWECLSCCVVSCKRWQAKDPSLLFVGWARRGAEWDRCCNFAILSRWVRRSMPVGPCLSSYCWYRLITFAAICSSWPCLAVCSSRVSSWRFRRGRAHDQSSTAFCIYWKIEGCKQNQRRRKR